MSDSKIVMNFAEDLNDINDVNKIAEYYYKHAKMIQKDIYNKIVILLTMCINKSLAIRLDDDDDIPADLYSNKVNEIYREVIETYKDKNSEVVVSLDITQDDSKEFLEYLNNMVVCLMSGIRYIEKKQGAAWNSCDEQNEWNTRYRREERVRDYMKMLISKEKKFTKFTIKRHIEIPYMYVLAWDLPTLFRTFNDIHNSGDDKSYITNLRSNTSIELRHISDNLLDILLNGVQIDREKFENSDLSAPIKFYKNVSYRNLLPTIMIVDKVDYSHDLNERGAWVKARKNHILPTIKKEVLSRTPLIPMESETGIYEPIKSLGMMVGLMKEENRTKDYLASDIVYLKDCIVEICEKILDWIWKDGEEFTRIEKTEAEQYLISIIKAANNVPRENSNENREDHIQKIVNVLAKKWDEKTLNNVTVKNEKFDSYVEYAYFSVLKLTRNWNEHNLLGKTSISFAVFLFVISVRYLMNINKMNIEWQREYMAEEIKLFKFFQDDKIDYEKIEIVELENEYNLLYENVNAWAFINEKGWAKNYPKTIEEKDPHQVLTAAGYKNSSIKNQMSENEIFLSFWLSIHMGKRENETQKIEHTRDSNLLELLERTFKYQKNSFLLNGLINHEVKK